MKKRNIFLACALILTICSSTFFGIVGGYLGARYAGRDLSQTFSNITNSNVEVVNEESAITQVVEEANPSVVSIVITKELPKYENSLDSFWLDSRRQVGTEEKQVGAGSGFFVSENGLIVTNKHVASEEDASYTIIMNDGSRKEAKVLARDTLLDIAFLKVEGNGFKPLKLGSSQNLKVGQSAIAIGNALGEFSNTVSTGVISGLGRDITATDSTGSSQELLDDVIQTDASINLGNSGGPLLDIGGNVIGVNVAVADDAQNIGFAIPIDVVKDLIDRLNTDGSITRPVLGVRYNLIDATFQKANNLAYDYGAYVTGNEGAAAVIVGSPAEKAGILSGDIILEVDGQKITRNDPLQNLIQKHKIGDSVKLKVFSKGAEKEIDVKLEKFELPQ